MTVAVATAITLAVLAAAMFAVAAVLQNGAVAKVVTAGPAAPRSMVGRAGFAGLARTPGWLAGALLAGTGSITHAVALVLAPVAIVQPIGVVAVPFAVMIGAWRTKIRPSAGLLVTVATCLIAVAGFVTLADIRLGAGTQPRFVGALVAAIVAGVLAGALATLGARSSGWWRCVAFAASGATAFGLVSALMRLVSLHITTGVNDLDDVGVLLPAAGIVAALVVGGWAVQQAHASGAPSVVVGCLTVLDPLVAVVLGTTMLGEGGSASFGGVAGLIGCAGVGLGAVLVLARHYPDSGRSPAEARGDSYPTPTPTTLRSQARRTQ